MRSAAVGEDDLVDDGRHVRCVAIDAKDEFVESFSYAAIDCFLLVQTCNEIFDDVQITSSEVLVGHDGE